MYKVYGMHKWTSNKKTYFCNKSNKVNSLYSTFSEITKLG